MILEEIDIELEEGLVETLEVERLGDGRFRLTQTPFSSDGSIRLGTVISAEPITDSLYKYTKVVSQSNYKSVTLVVGPLSDSKKTKLWNFSESNGVILEPSSLFEGVVVLNIPPGTRKDFMEKFYGFL